MIKATRECICFFYSSGAPLGVGWSHPVSIRVPLLTALLSGMLVFCIHGLALSSCIHLSLSSHIYSFVEEDV